MKIGKIILINIFVIFIFYNLTILLMILSSEIYSFYQNKKVEKNSNGICIRYSCYKNYEEIQWAANHFREYTQLNYHYETPVVWRANKFEGKTINISGKYNSRITVSGLNKDKIANKKIYFFGGSGMWGYGSNDENTIPSNFERISKIKSYNFAESAWNSNQSLFYLIKLLKEGHKPDLVVFLNGVNDISKCNSYENLKSDVIQERQIRRRLLVLKSKSNLTLEYYFSIPKEFFYNLKNKFGLLDEISLKKKSTICDKNKAKIIAENIYQNWNLANKLITDYGGKFYAVLEPHIIFNNPELYDYISTDDAQIKNVSIVYKEIEEKLNNYKYFKNFKNIYKGYQENFPIFIDTHHVSPNGNQIFAKEILNQIEINY